jgi:hypothetical protein
MAMDYTEIVLYVEIKTTNVVGRWFIIAKIK